MEETVIDDGVVMRNAVLSFTPPAPSRRSAAPAAALEMPLNTSVSADSIVELTNTGERTVRYRVMPCELRDYTITFSPSSGTLKPRRSAKLKAKLTVRSKVNTNCRVTVHINDGASSHVVTAKIRCDTGVFGVDPATLEAAVDPDCGARVPVLLINIKRRLAAEGGLTSEGIFRLAGEQTELRLAKDAINRAATAARIAGATSSATSSSSSSGATGAGAGAATAGAVGGPGCVLGCMDGLPEDVNDLATLIKIWYRELPQPLLNALPEARIVDSADVGACVAALDALEPVSRALLDWLLDLLLRVAANRAVTKMTAQNLAIVIAPNLYEATTPDPVQGLVMSQKAVQFVHNILLHMAREREKAAAAAASAASASAATTAKEEEENKEEAKDKGETDTDKAEAAGGDDAAKGKEKKKKSGKSRKGAKSGSVVLRRPKGRGRENGAEDEGGLSDDALADSGRKSPHRHHHRRHHHAESVVLSPDAERREATTAAEHTDAAGEARTGPGAETEAQRGAAADAREAQAECSDAQGTSEAEEEAAPHGEHEEVCHALKQATVFVEVVDEDEDEADGDEGATEDTRGEAQTEGAPEQGENEAQETHEAEKEEKEPSASEEGCTEKEGEASAPQDKEVLERKEETPATTGEEVAHGDPEQ